MSAWWPSDRIAGVVLVLVAVAIGTEALGFRVSFPTDPLGPRAFPLLAAAVLFVGGLLLILRPGEEPAWPARPGRLTLSLGVAALLVHASLLDVLGFFLSTTAVMTGLALLLGGPPRRSLTGSVAFAGALYLLFSYLLRLPLPIGSLFMVGD